MRRETCFVSHWKKRLFFLFLKWIFLPVWKQVKKKSLSFSQRKESCEIFFFSLFYFISNKKQFFFLSVKERRKKSLCFFHTVTHQENWRVKHLFHCFTEMEKHCLFLHLWNQVKKCHHRKKKIINLVNFSFSHGNVFTWFLSWKTEESVVFLWITRKKKTFSLPLRASVHFRIWTDSKRET